MLHGDTQYNQKLQQALANTDVPNYPLLQRLDELLTQPLPYAQERTNLYGASPVGLIHQSPTAPQAAERLLSIPGVRPVTQALTNILEQSNAEKLAAGIPFDEVFGDERTLRHPDKQQEMQQSMFGGVAMGSISNATTMAKKVIPSAAKYPKEIYDAYNRALGTSIPAKVIDKISNDNTILDMAAKGLQGGMLQVMKIIKGK